MKQNPDEDKTNEGEAPKGVSVKKHDQRRKKRKKRTDREFISGVRVHSMLSGLGKVAICKNMRFA